MLHAASKSSLSSIGERAGLSNHSFPINAKRSQTTSPHHPEAPADRKPRHPEAPAGGRSRFCEMPAGCGRPPASPIPPPAARSARLGTFPRAQTARALSGPKIAAIQHSPQRPEATVSRGSAKTAARKAHFARSCQNELAGPRKIAGNMSLSAVLPSPLWQNRRSCRFGSPLLVEPSEMPQPHRAVAAKAAATVSSAAERPQCSGTGTEGSPPIAMSEPRNPPASHRFPQVRT